MWKACFLLVLSCPSLTCKGVKQDNPHGLFEDYHANLSYLFFRFVILMQLFWEVLAVVFSSSTWTQIKNWSFEIRHFPLTYEALNHWKKFCSTIKVTLHCGFFRALSSGVTAQTSGYLAFRLQPKLNQCGFPAALSLIPLKHIIAGALMCW